MLQGNSSNHEGDFYCLNCFNSYTTKNKLKEHEEICNNHDSCRIEMPDWVNEIIKHNLGEKLLKKPFAIYLDLECLFKKLQSIQNNPEKSYTEKKARHEPSGWSMFTICSFNKRENKRNYYRRKDFKKLKKSVTEIINRKEKEMIPLTHEEIIFIMDKKYVIYAKKRFAQIKLIKVI